MPETLQILAIGAHPDDCEFGAGGVAAKWAGAGHEVRFLSVTNGDAGHGEMGGGPLARRRREEAEAAAGTLGIEYEVMDNHDGELEPTLDNRKALVRRIRRADPDLVLTHRPNDYHPDHRYTSILVQDSAYMVTVPNVCPDVPALSSDPVVAYLHDGFEKPYPFEADVAVAIDGVLDEKVEMLHRHASQVYEWLPANRGEADEVPDGEAERREWLREWLEERGAAVADAHRGALTERYGDAGREIEYAEAFEACEYGSPLTGEIAERLFPE